ncbi:MAG: hypothetical protein JNL69_11625 [Bacteroidia bacterium]|nr:hypothetical protein [Bacteroidia bacterium]
MTNITTPLKKEEITDSSKRRITSHQTTAAHLDNASKHHLNAAKHHESGEHEKAAECTLKAQGHVLLANEVQREDFKHLALKK